MAGLTTQIDQSIEQAKAAYQTGDYRKAALLFENATQQYSQLGQPLLAAEMANNLCVALLKEGDAKTAWQVVQDTDEVFAQAGDQVKRGMALGNQGTVLEALGKKKEAQEKYTLSAEILEKAGEKEMRVTVLESLSALQLKRKDQFGALATMQAALASKPKLNARENILKRLIHFTFQLLNR